jgi:hypothetical protein
MLARNMSERSAPLDLWRIAQVFLTTLHNLFGGADDIARKGALTRQAHAQLLRWLKAGEALLRFLLLIEAASLGPPAPSRKRIPRQRTPRRVEFWPDKPQDWRVRFSLPPRRGGSARQQSRGRREASHMRDAWPLALRYEALLRAYNDPAPYARRLARRLHTRPADVARVLTHAAGTRDLVGDEPYTNLAQTAARAWHERPDSS